jgi:NAD+ synthetase
MLPVAIAQMRPVKADPAGSLERISGIFREAAGLEPRPRALLFPETALTGYFLEGGVRHQALYAGELFAALRDRWQEAAGEGEPLEVGIGFYERRRGRIYNSALYAELGGGEPGIRHVHRKVFLPTYGVFQEDRFVEAGRGFHAFDTAWGRAALLVCEDAWHSISGTIAALDGAEVIFVTSASPAHGPEPGPGLPGNLERWDRLARGIAQEHGVFVVVAQLTGFEGGKGFPGGSLVVDPRGRRLARGPLWEPAVVTAGLDLETIYAARHETPLLADLEAALPRIVEGSAGVSGFGGTPDEEEDTRGTDRDDADRADAPAGAGVPGRGPAGGPGDGGPDPSDRTPLEIDPELVEEWLVEFLRQEIRERRGFDRAVVAVSGGVDSALTALLAARALGGDRVHGFFLPTGLSSDRSRRDAERVAEIGGFSLRTMDIQPAVEGYLEEHEPDASDLRRGNVMARQRMIVLYDQAKKLDALPVGSGNKSERLLGYFTWHADDTPAINPLGDLYKSQVWELARHVGVPGEIVEKAPTAELEPDQTDEDELGVTYRDADLVLHHFLHGRAPEELVERGFDPAAVEVVRDRLARTHWKRHLPTVAMLTDSSIGDGYLRPVDY